MKTAAVAGQLGQRLARNLDLIRQAREMTAADFARESGASRQVVSLWRRGKHVASLATLENIAAKLGVDPAVLIAKEPSEVLRGEE